MQALSSYIQHPDYIDATVVNELKLLCDSYPQYHVARMLMLQGMYRLHDDRFGTELRKAAIFLPDRKKIFHLTEGCNPDATVEFLHEVEMDVATNANTSDRTGSLIDSFLGQLPEAPQPRRARAIDASVDYISYLMQEDAPAPWVPTLAPVAEAPTPKQKEKSEEDEVENHTEEDEKEVSDAFFTETLAKIYIKQGKYDKALEIIKRLNLNFPEKNRYFADQIRFLEKLVVNEGYKNDKK